MTRLCDGKSVIEITMSVWDGQNMSPDLSNDFFDVGCLEYNAEIDAHKVKDVSYCVDQAYDWKNAAGDYCDDCVAGERIVWVDTV